MGCIILYIDNSKPKYYALTMLPYHLGRSALRPLVFDGSSGCARPLQAHERIQRHVPDGF